jgi:hypothetical protein
MLTVQFAEAFGQTPDVPVPQLDTNVVSIGGTLAQAESNLKAAFNALQTASVAAPQQTIAPEIIQAYTTARNGFAASVKVWIDGYNQTPEDQRNPDDPKAQPVLPPEIGVLTSSGFAGFGAVPAKGVLPSQLIVKYGPVGREKTSGLAASYYDPHFAFAEPYNNGLGAIPVLIIIGLALLAGTIIAVTALLTKESDQAKIARADADRQASVSDTAMKALQQRRDLILSCVGTQTGDPAKLATCTAAADQGAIPFLQALPKITPSGPSGTSSVLATIGVIAVIGVLVGGGYMIYRHGQRGRSLPRASRMRHGADEDFGDDAW